MPLFHKLFLPSVVWLSNVFLQGEKAAPCADPADGKKTQWGKERGDSWRKGMGRHEDFSLKHSGNDALTVWQPEGQVCRTLGGGRQRAGSQHPCRPCAHHPSHQRALSWAETLLMVADPIAFALRYPPQGEKTHLPFPRGPGVGSMGAAPFHSTGLAQAQSMAAQHSRWPRGHTLVWRGVAWPARAGHGSPDSTPRTTCHAGPCPRAWPWEQRCH